MNNILVNAKAYVSLASLIVAALLTEYGPDGKLGATLTVASVVLGALATWRVPNADAKPAADERGDAVVYLMLIAILLGVVLLLFRVRF